MPQITTIPKTVTGKEDLVVLPKSDYENMVRIIKGKNLNQNLRDALTEYENGDFYGPFEKTDNGLRFLKSRKTGK